MIFKEIDILAGLNEDNIEEITDVGEERLREKEESTDQVNIICFQCRDRVGFIIPARTDLPLRGYMINPHPGCENWPLPLDDATPLEFVCPHAQEEGLDQHLFVPLVEGRADLTNSFMDENHEFHIITKAAGECPCGCGGVVRGTRKYAKGLECYRKHQAKMREIEDGNN